MEYEHEQAKGFISEFKGNIKTKYLRHIYIQYAR